MSRSSALVAVLAFTLGIALAVPGGVAPAAGSVAGRATIADAQVVDAPIGERGAIMTPVVSCPRWQVEPRVRTVIAGVTSDFRKVYRYRGTYPGYGFPRVSVGDYRVKTIAYCRGIRSKRSELVTVVEKTRRRTISRAEFRAVKRGMSARRVREIVGYGGEFTGPYDGRGFRTYDMMAFWAIAVIEFQDGRVTRKFWDVGHD